VALSATAQLSSPPGIEVRSASGVPGTRGLSLFFDPAQATFSAGSPPSYQIDLDLGPLVADFIPVGDQATDLAGSTADPTGACAPGQIHINRNTGLTGDARNERAWLCSHKDTWSPFGDVLALGRAGGQILRGGTGAGDHLRLNPSSAANYTGSVTLCGDRGNMATNGWACAELFPDGYSITSAATIHTGLLYDAGVTQAVNGVSGFPYTYFFHDNHTHVVNDSALNATSIGSLWSFRATPTLRNATDDNLAGGAIIAGLEARPVVTATGSGTLTLASVNGLIAVPPQVGSNVTLSVARGLWVVEPAATSGTFPEHIALDVGNLTRATKNYWVKSAGSGVMGAVAGSMRVGSASDPTERLHVTGGNILVDAGSSTGHITIGEFNTTSDPAAPADNQARLYVRDNGAGKEQLVVRFNTGAVVVLATEP
jgi:hypothetical protein